MYHASLKLDMISGKDLREAVLRRPSGVLSGASPEPAPPGRFDGAQIHSHAYRNPSDPIELRGKRVAILTSTGGAGTALATVSDTGHTHNAGTLAGPSHTHAATGLTGGAHTHGAGTLAAESTLVIELAPLKVRCESCGAETEAEPSWLVCAACGSCHTQLVSGDEMMLMSVELVTAEGTNHV